MPLEMLMMNYQRENVRNKLDVQVPIINPVIFRERVPASMLSSTSNIGIHVEPLTHALRKRFENRISNYKS